MNLSVILTLIYFILWQEFVFIDGAKRLKVSNNSIIR